MKLSRIPTILAVLACIAVATDVAVAAPRSKSSTPVTLTFLSSSSHINEGGGYVYEATWMVTGGSSNRVNVWWSSASTNRTLTKVAVGVPFTTTVVIPAQWARGDMEIHTFTYGKGKLSPLLSSASSGLIPDPS